MKNLSKYMIILLLANQCYATDIEVCFNIASKHYQIPSKLLKAISKTETGLDPLAINVNSNKSYDMGIMQINSTWLPKLNKVGISQTDLFDGCKNIQIGAWILAQNIKQHGFTNKAIGAYNSPTPELQSVYYKKVIRNLD